VAVIVSLVFAGCSAGESGEAGTAVVSATSTTAGEVSAATSDTLATTSTVDNLTTAEPEPPPVPEEDSAETIVRDTWATSKTETERLHPLRVRVSGTDIDATIIDLGLNSDGTLEVPKDYSESGWYTGRPVPGELGPSIVVGHVDSTEGPAVFYELRNLEVGDLIEVDRSDGLIAWFKVSEIILVDKVAFPTERVYGPTDAPELRLITCGGSFDKEARSYRGNLIVFADHLGNYEDKPPVDAAT